MLGHVHSDAAVSAAAFEEAGGPVAAWHGEVLRSRAGGLLPHHNLESG